MRYSIIKRNDNFRIGKDRNGKYTSDELLKEVKTFDMVNKIIYKSSNVFREVSFEEFLEFKYCYYIIMDKKERDNMEKWLEFIKVNNINLRFLHKPLPKFYKTNMIEFEKLKNEI